MRLINADALKEHYAWWEEVEGYCDMKRIFDEIVDAQPTVATNGAVVRDRGEGLNIGDTCYKICVTRNFADAYKERKALVLNSAAIEQYAALQIRSPKVYQLSVAERPFVLSDRNKMGRTVYRTAEEAQAYLDSVIQKAERTKWDEYSRD